MANFVSDNFRKWEVHDVNADLNEQLLLDFRGERSGYLQVGEKKYFFPKKFAEQSLSYINFKPRRDDKWVISFPRSGTTLTQEMVWLLSNNLDYQSARKIPLAERFPFLEYDSCVNNHLVAEFLNASKNDKAKESGIKEICTSSITKLEKMASPRFIKTHLPLSLLPSDLLKCGAKVIAGPQTLLSELESAQNIMKQHLLNTHIIYIARNPKDVAVSFYHLHRLVKTLDFVGDFPKFWDYFEQNLILWSPYWEHVKEAWQLREHPNFKFIFYEEMKEDLRAVIREMSVFLGSQYNNENVMSLCKHLDISNFRENSAVNREILQDLGMLNDYSHRHIRKGENGSWKELFSKELDERADRWVCENLQKTDIKFPLGT